MRCACESIMAVSCRSDARGLPGHRSVDGVVAALIAFGLFRFWRPRAHPRWVAMRVNSAELAARSFLMAPD